MAKVGKLSINRKFFKSVLGEDSAPALETSVDKVKKLTMKNGNLEEKDFFLGTKKRGKGYGRRYHGFILSRRGSRREDKSEILSKALAQAVREAKK